MALLKSKSPRRSLTDEVRDHIRDRIAEGRYRPGERLREGAIAEFLDVKPVLVRVHLRDHALYVVELDRQQRYRAR